MRCSVRARWDSRWPRNLARAGFPVRVWNRSRDKAEPLAKDGVQVCDTPAQAGDGASVILTMLADTDAVLGAVDGPDGAFASAPLATASGPSDVDGTDLAADEHHRGGRAPNAAQIWPDAGT